MKLPTRLDSEVHEPSSSTIVKQLIVLLSIPCLPKRSILDLNTNMEGFNLKNKLTCRPAVKQVLSDGTRKLGRTIAERASCWDFYTAIICMIQENFLEPA